MDNEMTVVAGCSKKCLAEGVMSCAVGWPDGSCGARGQGTQWPSDVRDAGNQGIEVRKEGPMNMDGVENRKPKMNCKWYLDWFNKNGCVIEIESFTNSEEAPGELLTKFSGRQGEWHTDFRLAVDDYEEDNDHGGDTD